MPLLERQMPLELLEQCAQDLRAGQGRVVLVSGEAGLGKTSLLEHFAAARRGRERILWGRCDPLATPSPLGPFQEIAAQTTGRFPSLRAAADGSAVSLPGLLQDFKQAGPAIYVIEDLHWADEASLDAVKFLGRRIASVEAVLIATYRDDELHRQHALRHVLATLATGRDVRRIPLTALSVDAVRSLVPEGVFDADLVHRQTGGNPFVIAELLASGDAERVPRAVRDIVLQRAAR
ncbi:MAG: AAA family ATPase, partial [Microvirga sp.]